MSVSDLLSLTEVITRMIVIRLKIVQSIRRRVSYQQQQKKMKKNVIPYRAENSILNQTNLK